MEKVNFKKWTRSKKGKDHARDTTGIYKGIKASKPYNSFDLAGNHSRKLREIWAFLTVRCITGVSSSPSKASKLFLAVDTKLHKRKKSVTENGRMNCCDRSVTS